MWVNTTEYEKVHGKKPRGHQWWAFTPNDNYWPRGDMPDDGIAWVWGYYSDAKREIDRKWPLVVVWQVYP